MPLHLAPASKSDIPQLVNLYFTTFKSPLVLRVKPDVPPVREWFRKNLESDMEKAYTRVYKVVESEEEGAAAADEGEIIAFAKWNAPFVEEVGKGKDEEGLETEGKWPADGDVALFKEIVEKVTEKKRILMENKSFWYLGVLATLPQHQRRGAGSMLMTEFCKQADEEGHWGFLEASPAGRPTYERFGFVTRDRVSCLIDGEDYVDCCMVREPKGGR